MRLPLRSVGSAAAPPGVSVDSDGRDFITSPPRATASSIRPRRPSALTGAGFGAFFGLLLGLFSAGFAWLGMALTGAMIGAAWGAGLGFATQKFAGGGRTYASTRNLVASHYDLIARGGLTDRARNLLAQAGLLTT